MQSAGSRLDQPPCLDPNLWPSQRFAISCSLCFFLAVEICSVESLPATVLLLAIFSRRTISLSSRNDEKSPSANSNVIMALVAIGPWHRHGHGSTL